MQSILGACSCHILQSSNVKVLLFGEFHYDLPNTQFGEVLISSYLDSLFRSHPKTFFDMFIEVPYSKNYKPQKRPPTDERKIGLLYLFDKSYMCMSSIREKSPDCKNIRVHAVDVRKKSDILTPSIDRSNTLEFLNPVLHMVLDHLWWKNKPGYANCIEWLELVRKELSNKEVLKFPEYIKESLKDIDTSIPEFKVGYKILSDTYNQGITVGEIRQNIDKIISLIKADKINEALSHIYMIQYYLISGMDIYALSRVMTRYSKPPHHAKNIIIASGNDHTKVYLDFFQKIGFKLVYSDNRCVDSSSLRVKVPPIWLFVKTRCNFILSSGRRCTRSCESGERCYQHRKK